MPSISVIVPGGPGPHRAVAARYNDGAPSRFQPDHSASKYSKPLGFLPSSVMPTVLRIDGLRVAIYPNDHRPPHVHVIGAGGEAVFLLNCPTGPALLRESYGLSGRELGQVSAGLLPHIPALCARWGAIHGAV